MYCRHTCRYTARGHPITAGHPPLQTSPARSVTEVVTANVPPSPSNSPLSPILPVESPDSSSDMGLMWTRAILPAPLWEYEPYEGIEEPVSRNSPGRLPSWSICLLTVSLTVGISCHSSMRCGESPTRTILGSARTSAADSGVQMNLALGVRLRRPCLAAVLWPVDLNRPEHLEQLVNLHVYKARDVAVMSERVGHPVISPAFDSCLSLGIGFFARMRAIPPPAVYLVLWKKPRSISSRIPTVITSFPQLKKQHFPSRESPISPAVR